LQNLSRTVYEKPEMVLVIYEPDRGSYDCRIFYKEGRRAGGSERIVIEGSERAARRSGVDGDPVTRLAHVKVGEFHAFRQELLRRREPAPLRRVFYSHEI